MATAFATYQSVKQQQDANFPFQMVTDAEYPQAIQNISAAPAANDPTIFLVSAAIISRSRTPITLTRVIGQPNPISVLSGNAPAALLYGADASNVGFLQRG